MRTGLVLTLRETSDVGFASTVGSSLLMSLGLVMPVAVTGLQVVIPSCSLQQLSCQNSSIVLRGKVAFLG